MTTKPTDTTYPEIQDIKNDLDSLKNNVVELTKHIKSDGADKSHQLAQDLSQRLLELKDSGRSELDKVAQHVQQKPGQSLAIAFAAGLLASVLLGRR